MTQELEFLIALLEEAFRQKKAWHGPTLTRVLRGVSAQQAAWRPAAGRHSIQELTLHAAYWKFVARRRLTGERRIAFGVAGANWFPCPDEPNDGEWKRHVALLVKQHRELCRVVSEIGELDPARVRLIRGVACHDLYHAGQIQLLKRLCPLDSK